MYSAHLPFPIFLVLAIVFLAIFIMAVRRNLQIFKISSTANNEETKAELQKMLTSLKTDGKLNSKAFISVQKTGINGTTSNSIETEGVNPFSLIKEFVALAEENNRIQSNPEKINTLSDTSLEVIEDKDNKGIID